MRLEEFFATKEFKKEKMKLMTMMGLITVLLFFPMATGYIAKSFGRKFWFWFLMGLSFPFMSLVLLLCLPLKRQKEQVSMIAKSFTQTIYEIK